MVVQEVGSSQVIVVPWMPSSGVRAIYKAVFIIFHTSNLIFLIFLVYHQCRGYTDLGGLVDRRTTYFTTYNTIFFMVNAKCHLYRAGNMRLIVKHDLTFYRSQPEFLLIHGLIAKFGYPYLIPQSLDLEVYTDLIKIILMVILDGN